VRTLALSLALFAVGSSSNVPGARQAPSQPSPEIYPSGAGVIAPIPIDQPAPTYTLEAMRERIQGSVTMDVVVGIDGRVTDVRVVGSLDDRYGLDAEAVKTARRWTFRPGRLVGGRTVPVRITLILEFILVDDKNGVPAPDVAFSLGTVPTTTPGLVAAKLLVQAYPQYTTEAMRAGIEGDVALDVAIGTDGSVLRARIARSLDKRFGLDQEALKTVKRYRFEAGRLNGNPVATIQRLIVEFRQ